MSKLDGHQSIDEQLYTENIRMIRLFEAIYKMVGDILDEERRAGPTIENYATEQEILGHYQRMQSLSQKKAAGDGCGLDSVPPQDLLEMPRLSGDLAEGSGKTDKGEGE
jgi:hypothetical protein